jgi:hypothetical protein
VRARAGLEVGFYSGCVHMWRRLQAQDPATIPDRAARGLATLEQLLSSFPLDDPMVRWRVCVRVCCVWGGREQKPLRARRCPTRPWSGWLGT